MCCFCFVPLVVFLHLACAPQAFVLEHTSCAACCLLLACIASILLVRFCPCPFSSTPRCALFIRLLCSLACLLQGPWLSVDYFFARDVYSDDPFTPQVEPPVPFSLGLLIHNNGAGPAKNLQITSSQPTIIDNEKGEQPTFCVDNAPLSLFEASSFLLSADFFVLQACWSSLPSSALKLVSITLALHSFP